MGFQSTINPTLALSVPGERYTDAPHRSQSGILVSTPQLNTVGSVAYTLTSDGGEGTTPIVQAGGTGAYMGILVNPKVYSSPGTSGVPLGPTLVLPDQSIGELATQGEYVVTLPAAANIGDLVMFDQTTGIISTIAPVATYTGAIAVTTGILTVSAITAGALGPNTPIYNASGAVIAHITGYGNSTTGGTGTYTTDIITAVSSAALTSPTVAPVGSTIIPGASVQRYNVTAAGLGVIKL